MFFFFQRLTVRVFLNERSLLLADAGSAVVWAGLAGVAKSFDIDSASGSEGHPDLRRILSRRGITRVPAAERTISCKGSLASGTICSQYYESGKRATRGPLSSRPWSVEDGLTKPRTKKGQRQTDKYQWSIAEKQPIHRGPSCEQDYLWTLNWSPQIRPRQTRRLRLVLELDGGAGGRGAVPDIGYLHRRLSRRTGEHLDYNQYGRLRPEMNYISRLAHRGTAWHGAVEKSCWASRSRRESNDLRTIRRGAGPESAITCGLHGADGDWITGRVHFFHLRVLSAGS